MEITATTNESLENSNIQKQQQSKNPKLMKDHSAVEMVEELNPDDFE